jgi:hypothetical protein
MSIHRLMWYVGCSKGAVCNAPGASSSVQKQMRKRLLWRPSIPTARNLAGRIWSLRFNPVTPTLDYLYVRKDKLFHPGGELSALWERHLETNLFACKRRSLSELPDLCHDVCSLFAEKGNRLLVNRTGSSARMPGYLSRQSLSGCTARTH